MKEDRVGPDGVRLVFDLGDPDTPAIVEWQGATATYDCACETGALTGTRVDDVYLTREQLDWLEQFQDEVANAYSIARAGRPEYS